MATSSSETSPQTWWLRNWKWLLPVGCLVIVGFLGAVVLAVFSIGMTGIKSSAVYQQAIEQTLTNKLLQARLGSPFRPGPLVTGEITYHQTLGESTHRTGEAKLRIPLRGPQGKATLYVEATRQGETWTVQQLEAVIKETDERLNLLGPGL